MTDNTINDAVTMAGGGAVLGRIDQYELVRELGGGGFGTVYLAKDTVSGIEVAVKGLPPLVRNNREELENVRSNFALVSRLSHTNIAKALVLHPVKEVSYASEDVRQKLRVLSGDFLMVMEYAPGVTLSQWRKQFPGNKVPLAQALDIVRQVASAIDYAHERRIVHRDIQPANVTIATTADGKTVVRILDFGLAAEIRSSMGRMSREIHDTSGTRPYMAPEQWLGGKQGSATDQYALAVLFHELITGEVPFSAVFDTGDPVVMMNVVGREQFTPPDGFGKPVRLALEKALAKKPEERFASCVEFVAALEGKVKVSRRGAETRSGGSGIWKALGVLALLAALGGGLWWTVNEKGMNGTTETVRTTNAPSVSSVPSVPSVPVVSDSRQPTNDSSRAAAEVASRQAKEANARERAAEFIRLKTRISIKQSDAKHKMDSIAGFREDQGGLEEHIKSADREWKTLFALPAPETLEEAQAAFEIADKAEAQIALDFDWLAKNNAGRDAAKAAKSEIAALLAGDIATFKAEKYAADAFREGGKLREAADAAFEKGDFGEAGRMMGEAKEKFASAAHDAKSFFIKTTLESAKTYFDAAKWDDCIAECGKVLGWDASNETAKKLKADAESHIGPRHGDVKTLTLPGGAKMEMIYVGPGSFMMGSPESEDGRDNDETQHRVTLTKGFWLGKYEVTQSQWQSVMGNNPSYFKSNDRPVENVSWEDCQQFIQKVNASAKQQLGGGARLPTEAEWEYACRAGTTTAYYWGNALNGDKANCDGNNPCGTTAKGQFKGETTSVGSYGANPWGFFDMHGNVWEWCQDWYGSYNADATDPQGPASGGYRVLRGGCWNGYARDCRSANRLWYDPGNRNYYFGFRLCCSAE